MLNPFDLANILQLLQEVRPGTVFEIGTAEGGRTVWLADTLQALGCATQIVAVDINAPAAFDDPRIQFIQGDAAMLGSLMTKDMLDHFPRPWIVIEDAAHFGDLTESIVRFFVPLLQSGDWLLIEDGILNQFTGNETSAISAFIDRFLQSRGDAYAIATEYCDRFGYNVTSNPNGWLTRR
jgi:cephalosporin hydroxylase